METLADILAPAVALIETSPALTRGHYAKYMGLISRFADDEGQALALCQALIAAGANRQGVADAMNITYPARTLRPVHGPDIPSSR